MRIGEVQRTLLITCVLIVGAIWTLAASAFVLVVCAAAQVTALLTSTFLFALTGAFELPNLIKSVAAPRVNEMRRDLTAALESIAGRASA